MKKTLLFICLVFVAAACTTPTTNRGPASNTNTAPIAKTAAVTTDDAVAKEKAIWELLQKKDYDGFGNLLDSNYAEVSANSVEDKQSSLKTVRDLVLTDVTFSDWKMVEIDKDAFLITYTANQKGSFQGKDFPLTAVRASSAWVNRDGKWLGIYHQETEIKKAAPAATPKPSTEASKAPASPTGSPTGSPAAKLAEAGPDAVANEKLVWDALKTKNYDAFAALLAPESIEVEPDGVYDKAASVKGVSAFDASKVELSDWKTVVFDSDASLVTYLIKIPGAKPDHERHATVWVNRGGKWLALFHQGTPATEAEAPPAKAGKKID